MGGGQGPRRAYEAETLSAHAAARPASSSQAQAHQAHSWSSGGHSPSERGGTGGRRLLGGAEEGQTSGEEEEEEEEEPLQSNRRLSRGISKGFSKGGLTGRLKGGRALLSLADVLREASLEDAYAGDAEGEAGEGEAGEGDAGEGSSGGAAASLGAPLGEGGEEALDDGVVDFGDGLTYGELDDLYGQGRPTAYADPEAGIV